MVLPNLPIYKLSIYYSPIVIIVAHPFPFIFRFKTVIQNCNVLCYTLLAHWVIVICTKTVLLCMHRHDIQIGTGGSIQKTSPGHRTNSKSCDSPPWNRPQSIQVGDTGRCSELWGFGSQSAKGSDTRDELHHLSQRSRTPRQ